ncbi:MAG: trehalase family glycosidase [Bacteroidota bacterium]
MVKYTLLLIVSLFIFAFGMAQSTTKLYHPKYTRQWKDVVAHINQDWIKEKARSKDLPHSYITVWPGLPFMFYWDTYFINKGLYLNQLDSIAKNNCLNLLHAVDSFGFVGNAVITPWGMNRSQPPYLSPMVRALYENSIVKDTAFLSQAYFTLRKEYIFWTDTSATALEKHNTSIKGLQRFYHHASTKELVILYRELASRFHLKMDIADSEKIKVAIPFAVEAESGMDFTPRFEHRSPDFVAVELNCLLYQYELNFAWMVKMLALKKQPDWLKMANHRKALINKYCWDETRGLYLDYDYVNHRRSKIAAATCLQPLWAGVASGEQARRLVKNLPILEGEWGIANTEKCGEIKNYQWGENSIWCPMQLLVAEGLDRYGYKKDAERIAAKFLDIVTKNFIAPVPASFNQDGKTVARKPGRTYEKYKVDGALNDDEYPASEMLGWTAGCFLWCYKYVVK